MRALVIMLVAACGVSRSAPTVKIVYDQTEVPENVTTPTNAGANAWASLGVDGGPMKVGTREDNRECALDWYDTEITPCTITIHVTFAAASSLGGKAGLTSNRRTLLAYELTGEQLESVTAHEVGHSLWNTSEHLPDGEIGIMASAAQGIVPTDADVAFAVEHTHGWVQP